MGELAAAEAAAVGPGGLHGRVDRDCGLPVTVPGGLQLVVGVLQRQVLEAHVGDQRAGLRVALQQHQLPTRNLKAEGRGESQLVVSDCRARYPNQKAQRTQCDQPNRRVEIVLYGTTAGNIPGQ